MPLNLFSLAQIILITIFGAFSGSLFSIFVDRKFFPDQAEISTHQTVLETILGSLKISLYVGGAILALAGIDTLLAFNSIDLKFVADDSFIEAFGWGFFATIIGTLGKAFKAISVSKDKIIIR